MTDVRFERQGRVLIATFDRRPAINASTPEMMAGWYDALRDAAADDSIGAVVTAAAGRGWCVGADVQLLLRHQDSSTQVAAHRLDDLAWELLKNEPPSHRGQQGLMDDDWDELGLNTLATFLSEYPKPLIAAIAGPVAGGGFPLALLHDVRFVAPAASFRTSFVGLGLVSELGLGYLLPRHIGLGRALDICMSGRVVGAQEALELGLVERLVDEDLLLEQAVDYAGRLAAQPAASLAAVKSLVRHSSSAPFRDYLREEWAFQRTGYESAAAAEQVKAMADRFRGSREPS